MNATFQILFSRSWPPYFPFVAVRRCFVQHDPIGAAPSYCTWMHGEIHYQECMYECIWSMQDVRTHLLFTLYIHTNIHTHMHTYKNTCTHTYIQCIGKKRYGNGRDRCLHSTPPSRSDRRRQTHRQTDLATNTIKPSTPHCMLPYINTALLGSNYWAHRRGTTTNLSSWLR
jgi:hypothetical protein